MRSLRTLAAAAAGLTFAVTGCSGSESQPDSSTVEASKPYNDADIAFATDMIQHHAQALQLVDMTMTRKLDPRVAALAEDIRMAQVPEIEQMVDLLDEWDNQPIPETSRDHAHAHGGGSAETDTTMPGMISAEEMDELESTRGAEFESQWLTAMIEHHQGAIKMAMTEEDRGEDKVAKALARDIVEAQGDQISMMEALEPADR
jgi:uncharacterized protein (DUF305 family)